MMKLQLAVLILFFTVIGGYYYANLSSTVSFVAEVQKGHNSKTLNETQAKKDGELNKFAMSNEKGTYLKNTFAQDETLEIDILMEKLLLSLSDDDVVVILREISILVCEYDTAAEFVEFGYFDFLLELLFHDDPAVIEVTLEVLSSAKQGHPNYV